MKFREIRCLEDMVGLVDELGFLPFFKNPIPGFSVEACCAKELWFSDGVDGPWEWKGPAAQSGHCMYGKFFGGKAGFVSRTWLPDFCNFRRDGYDFDARYDDELASHKDKVLYDTVAEHGALLSRELKALCNYRKGGNRGFDTVVTRLQMQTYLAISDFVYRTDKAGKTYGWGVAQYSTPEALFGHAYVTGAYARDPQESKKDILSHLKAILPDASEAQIQRWMLS